MNIQKWRTARVLTDGKWEPVPFENIMRGDRFQLFNGPEKIFEGQAHGDAKPCDPPGNFEIVAEAAPRQST